MPLVTFEQFFDGQTKNPATIALSATKAQEIIAAANKHLMERADVFSRAHETTIVVRNNYEAENCSVYIEDKATGLSIEAGIDKYLFFYMSVQYDVPMSEDLKSNLEREFSEYQLNMFSKYFSVSGVPLREARQCLSDVSALSFTDKQANLVCSKALNILNAFVHREVEAYQESVSTSTSAQETTVGVTA